MLPSQVTLIESQVRFIESQVRLIESQVRLIESQVRPIESQLYWHSHGMASVREVFLNGRSCCILLFGHSNCGGFGKNERLPHLLLHYWYL